MCSTSVSIGYLLPQEGFPSHLYYTLIALRLHPAVGFASSGGTDTLDAGQELEIMQSCDRALIRYETPARQTWRVFLILQVLWEISFLALNALHISITQHPGHSSLLSMPETETCPLPASC